MPHSELAETLEIVETRPKAAITQQRAICLFDWFLITKRVIRLFDWFLITNCVPAQMDAKTPHMPRGLWMDACSRPSEEQVLCLVILTLG